MTDSGYDRTRPQVHLRIGGERLAAGSGGTAIITGNGPLTSLTMKLPPALAAGNTVVVKPPEFTPFTAGLFADVVERAGFLVQEPVYAEAVDRVADIVKGIRVGDPWDTETDIGPAVNAAAADRILGMIDRAHRVAERLVAGDTMINGAPNMMVNRPKGGFGLSGFGKEGGPEGLAEFQRIKTVAML